jgi:DNA repair exonuclease SbcCD ATPase subunit
MRDKIERAKVEHRAAREAVRRERIATVEAEDLLACAVQAQDVVQRAGQAVQQAAHDRLATVVSRCLEAVFDEPYEFCILFERKRGRTEARLVFVRDGVEINPMDAAGGGVVDVASFALRLSCLMLKRPRVRRFLVLDEPWKHLSETYRPRLRECVEQLAEEMDLQVFLITHSDEFRIGRVVKLGKN